MSDSAQEQQDSAQEQQDSAQEQQDSAQERSDSAQEQQDDFRWWVDSFSCFRGRLHVDGWAFHRRERIKRVEVRLATGKRIEARDCRLPSADVESQFGNAAKRCRFTIEAPVGDADLLVGASLVFRLSRRQQIEVDPLSSLAGDPYHVLLEKFVATVSTLDKPTVLDIGSRARSWDKAREWLPKGLHYIGFDIMAGANVDVVGDAHELSKHFPHSSIDAAFAISTIEHLAMPWRVVLELNRVLKSDGIALFSTHQTWPLHDVPWDFFRFSSSGWKSLFNEATGFTILDTAMGEPCSVVANFVTAATAGLDRQPAFLATAVLVQKTGPTDLRWDVDASSIVEESYFVPGKLASCPET